MADVLDGVLSHSRDQLRDATGRIGSAGEKLGGLLLAGNGAALGLVMKAGLDGSSCSPGYLHGAALPFMVGVGSAFLAGIGSWISGLALVNLLAQGTRDLTQSVAVRSETTALEAKGIALTEDSPLGKMAAALEAKIPIYQGRLRRIMFSLALPIALYAVSAASFIDGVASPLRHGLTCPSEK